MEFYSDVSYELLEQEAQLVPAVYEIAQLALEAYTYNPDGMFLEFGTYKGGTITRIADALPDTTIYGFDTFKGLPETWVLNERCSIGRQVFDLKGNLPKVPANAILIPGTFDKTLLSFYSPDHKISFIHIDCDLYSSTVDIFKYYESNLLDNCILAFDDLGCGRGNFDSDGYEFWKNGEAKAFIEMIQRTGYSWRMLSRDDGDYNRYAIQIRR